MTDGDLTLVSRKLPNNRQAVEITARMKLHHSEKQASEGLATLFCSGEGNSERELLLKQTLVALLM